MYRLGKSWLSFASVIEDEYDDVMDYIKHGNSIPEPVVATKDAPDADESKEQEVPEQQETTEPVEQEQQKEKQEPEKQEEPEIKEIIVVKPKRAPAKRTKK